MSKGLENLKGYATKHLPTLRSIEIFGDSLGDEETRNSFNEALLQMYNIGVYMGWWLTSLPGEQCYSALESYLTSRDRKDLPQE